MIEEKKMAFLLFSVGMICIGIGIIYNFLKDKNNEKKN